MKRKTITLIATLGLLLTGCRTNTSSVLASDSLTPETSTDHPKKEHTGIKTVTPLNTEIYDILVCYPENNISDTSKLSLTNTAPIFLYFGDGAYTADTAKELLKKNGLAEVAAEQGSSIVIVNPLNGSTWSDQDKDVYSAIYSLFSDSSSATLTDGISIDPTDETKTKKIAGSYQRIYVYAVGKGADFAAENVVKKEEGDFSFPNGASIHLDETISGASLEKMTKTVTLTDRDIPLFSIGNSSAIEEGLKHAGTFIKAEKADYRPRSMISSAGREENRVHSPSQVPKVFFFRFVSGKRKESSRR